METLLRRTILTLLVIILCGVVFHAPLVVWLGTIFPGQAVLIKAWKECLIVVAALLLIIDVTRRRQWRGLASSWVLRLSLVYLIIHGICALIFWGPIEPIIAGLLIDTRYVVFFMLIYTACHLYPGWRRVLLWGSAIAAALSLLFAILQVTVLPRDALSHIGYNHTTISPYLTVDRNEAFVRINGTLRGPNPLGVYAVIIGSLVVALLLRARREVLARHRLAPLLVTIAGVGSLVALWYSYARSALVAAAVAVLYVVVALFGRRLSRVTWVGIGMVLILAGALVYGLKDTTFVSNVILHENPHGGSAISSNDGHWSSLVEGASRLVRQPLGAGIGSTGSPSLMTDHGLILENQYLYIAHEVGWAGLASFLALFSIIMCQLWRRRRSWVALGVGASGLGLAVAAIVLPVWVDDTVSIVWWGLAAISLHYAPNESKKEKKRGSRSGKATVK